MPVNLNLFRQAAVQWSKHNAPRLGAALAYYTILSLAPTLVLLVALCGLLFGEQAVRGELYWQVKDVVGEQSAAIVQALLKDARRPSGVLATVLESVILLFGASGVFVELRDTLNYIWDAPARPQAGLRTILRDRFFSFAVVLGIGLVLALSLAANTLLIAAFPGALSGIPATANYLVTFVITSFLFAVIYRIIPEVRVEWEDVVIGAGITSLLFAAGRFLIGLYLREAHVGTAYGAAGSMIVFTVWVYYSAQIFLYGAEFTNVYARSRRLVSSAPERPVNC